MSTDYLLSLTDDKTVYRPYAKASQEDKRVLQLYHKLSPENQECIRGMMIALDRQDQLSNLLQSENEHTKKEPQK
ncbi:MAG: hypothetical protein MR020_01015 [Lachnospiraceae bacterium]|nr:hypothetical protein [Lachnospiraceae bacterium]